MTLTRQRSSTNFVASLRKPEEAAQRRAQTPAAAAAARSAMAMAMARCLRHCVQHADDDSVSGSNSSDGQMQYLSLQPYFVSVQMAENAPAGCWPPVGDWLAAGDDAASSF